MGTVIEISRIIDLNKVFESALIIIVCFLIVAFSIELFQYHKKKYSALDPIIAQKYKRYISPYPMYLSLLMLAGAMDTLLIWNVSFYERPFASVIVAATCAFLKGKKLVRLFNEAGIKTKELTDTLETFAKNKGDIFETARQLKDLKGNDYEN